MRAAAITFVYNESFNLPIWIRYFGRQFGEKNLFVVDLGTTDGSTDDLGDVNKIALPRDEFDEYAKTNFINYLQKGLLDYYDTVIYTDADELVVPDPARYADLATYLSEKQFDYASCVGLNIIHILTQEEPLDITRPIMPQRRFARFLSATCKPSVARVPMNWATGFHCSDKPPRIDPDLYLFHTKWMDFNLSLQRHKISREAAYSKRTVEQGLGAHSRYDIDRFVREGFLDAVNVLTEKGIAPFDFSSEIAQIDAGASPGSNIYFIPMNISKLVEIPERFRTSF